MNNANLIVRNGHNRPYIETTVFQIFLDQFAKPTKGSDKRIVLVVDNASWLHAATSNWHHIVPMYQPTYFPDLNPIERLWFVIKNRFFTNWFTRDPDKLLARFFYGHLSL